MTPNNRSEEACERASELTLRLGEAHVPTDAERAFLDEHLSHCESCRMERRAAEVLAHTGDSGPAEPLDEFSRRRFVNYVVTAALTEGGDGSADLDVEGDSGPAPALEAPPSRRRLRWWWAAAAVALLAVGISVGVVWQGLDRRSRAPGRSGGEPTARLVLQSGQVTLNGGTPGERAALRPGSRVAVVRGRAALALPDEAFVLLEERSAVQVRTLDAKHIELHLQRGELLASVQPRRDRRRFVVTTPNGRVEVTGTVFAVRVRRGVAEVRVLRGQVRVRSKQGAGLDVPRGQTTRLGAGPLALRAMTDAEERRDTARAASLTALGSRHSARVIIRSRPAGAQVDVDGVGIGRTPLMARVKAGHRLLTVRLPGRTPIRERLTLAPADRLVRDYELGRAASAVLTRPLARPASPTAPPARPLARPMKPGTEDAMVLAPAVVSRRPPAPRPRTVPVPPKADARTLLTRARQRRAVHDWTGAARAYQAILRSHGRSAEARAARVALGLLRLDHLGNPAGALRLFDSYLAGTRRGPLAQEAAYGRIRALRRLGRAAAERRALRDFLHYYPGALQEPYVKRRLRLLQAPPPRPRPEPANPSPDSR